ncbi:hypothetical protein CASFOL_010214 [Castilleja foliolosa]|uniref:Uncharacterized protein n=1 Tax=Castilleja foliolosa TaxID=1961234 RepID=A0ABD3DVM4_9LAMI
MAAGEGEIHFPEPIIQRIQSFLNGKKAAQTTILSKSWHSAWLTRPNLDLDDSHFKGSHNRRYSGEYKRSSVDDFKVHSKKTIERYEQSNLKIESFNLCMYLYHYDYFDELAEELIVKALRIGATRICLRLDRNKSFVLPNEVFGADNLVELSVRGCTIKLDDRVVIKCRRLESLSLDDDVSITIDAISKIVSSCPSIENLSIFSKFYQRCDKYVFWSESSDDEYERVEEQGPRVDASATAMPVGVVDNLIPRLRCLVLDYAWFSFFCLGDLLSRFPFLKDFTLYLNRSSKNIGTVFEEGIQISNCSLERIKLAMKGLQRYYSGVRRPTKPRRPRVKFDVPSVRKLTIECAAIPILSFISKPPSREWESHLSIECEDHLGLSTIWFKELSELLTELSQSKTHLFLNATRNMSSFDYKVGDNIIIRKHELENLTLEMTNLLYSSCYPLFDGLFRLCRPKLITQYYNDLMDDLMDDNNMQKTNIDLLCQILEEGIKFKVSSPTQFMYGLNDLEEVKAQINFDVDDDTAEWMPIPLELLLDEDSPHKYVHKQQRIRFLLKWKPI